MRTGSAMIALVAASVLALGLFTPNLTGTGQYAGSPVVPVSAPTPLIAPAITLTAMHGNGGGVLHGGGAWRGGGVWLGGAYDHSRFLNGYRGYGEPYYIRPTCDWVWDNNVDQWVCLNEYY